MLAYVDALLRSIADDIIQPDLTSSAAMTITNESSDKPDFRKGKLSA